MFDYAGSIHFHSSYSYDARIPLADILKEAGRAELDFAIVTDHFRLDARFEGFEGYHGNVLLLVGEEISPRYNHYLALGIKKPIVTWKAESHPQKYIDEVAAQGGFGFISHPEHAGAPLIGGRAYPWIDWNVHGYAGLGIWDLASDWSSSLSSIWKTLAACRHPERVLKGPSPKTLERWDRLTQKDHCVAIGEIDNHAHSRRFFLLSRVIFPFEFAFRTIRTHVLLEKSLTKNAVDDQKIILEAIRQGQSYVSNDFWKDPKGFSFRIFDEAKTAWPGGEFTRHGATLLEAKLPSNGKLRLIRDGHLVKEESRRTALQWDVDLPGVYRIEALHYVCGQWRSWIYSNPIWVK